jgi:large subunit ribosomal protein L22
MKKSINKIEGKIKLARSVNKNVRSSTKKLNPILKAIVGKKVDVAIRDLTFSDKRISNDIKKNFVISNCQCRK